jgi:hypothetical protein
VRIKLTAVPALLLLAFLALLVPPHALSDKDDKKPGRRVTLVHPEHPKSDGDFKRSTVIFRPTLAYNRVTGVNHEWDLKYGGLNFNGSKDWFIIDSKREGGRHWNRIRDLGELNWSDEIEIPVLPILPCRIDEQCGRIQIPPRNSGRKIEDEDVNPHVAKIIVGHMYAIHIFEGERDLNNPRDFLHHIDYYALVRVEELKPNERVTITWKKVSGPKE